MTQTNRHTRAPKAHATSTWANDALPKLSADEAQLAPKSLAKMPRIIHYAAQYWGGKPALIALLVFLVALVFAATNDTFEGIVRDWLAELLVNIGDGNGLAVWKMASMPLFVALLIGAGTYFVRSHYKNQALAAWGFSIIVLLLATIHVKIGARLIEWSGPFWEAVKEKDSSGFTSGLVLFTELAFLHVFVSTYLNFFTQMLQIRWRTWLTEGLTTTYFNENRSYHLSQTTNQDNPDQRISEDLNKFTDLGISLFFGFYIATLSVYEFSQELIKVSDTFEFSLFSHDFSIPLFMFWAVIAYTIISSLITHLVGRRLVKINILGERYNADFRYHLVRSREYAENIAFLNGGENQKNHARELFAIVRSNWNNRMWQLKYLGFTTSMFGQASVLLPIVLTVPRYFAGAIKFGVIQQTIRGFNALYDALSWFISNYSDIAAIRAAATRIFNLESSLAQVDQFNAASDLKVTQDAADGVSLSHVYLNRPQLDSAGKMRQEPQVLGLDWHIEKGDRWLVTGVSGSGKSTILRAVSGLWFYGKGRIEMPADKTVFLPQRPYFPIASLRDALSYPQSCDVFSDEAFLSVLEMSQLSHLKSRLSESGNWGQMLSGGEQQRLALARVFLVRPEYLFLDEATSALDTTNEAALYATLLEFLPHITLISISHHTQLSHYHSRGLTLVADPIGGFKAKVSVL